MGLLSWAMARYYDAVMLKAEKCCLGRWRSELLGELSGRVLEVGAGTGANLPYYPETVTELFLTEPDRHMRSRLEVKLVDYQIPHTVFDLAAEILPFENESFDAVVVTLVLCSVQNQQQSLEELYRILKPGGFVALIEYIKAPEPSRTLLLQKVLEPLWKRCAGNCHLTRDTLSTLQSRGFDVASLVCDTLSGAPQFAAPVIRGIAKKP